MREAPWSSWNPRLLFSTVMRLAYRLGAVDVTMSVLRRYVVAAPHHVADPLFREAIAYAAEHGFAGVETELRSHRAGRPAE